MIDLVERLRGIVGESVRYKVIEYPDSYPADEPMRRSPDIRKARLQLGFNPEVGLDEGLKRFSHGRTGPTRARHSIRVSLQLAMPGPTSDSIQTKFALACQTSTGRPTLLTATVGPSP